MAWLSQQSKKKKKKTKGANPHRQVEVVEHPRYVILKPSRLHMSILLQ
jgi:hypothetical protein